MPVKWVKNSVKFTATPDYPNAIYIYQRADLQSGDDSGSGRIKEAPEIRGAPLSWRNF